MLFLQSPLTLPVLNIPLPLLGFYSLTPVIFVIVHFYTLLNLVLLARTAKSFEDALALITLALAPVALLLMIEIKFLPCHSEWITWWHRLWLLIDIVLVWTLWPGYRSGWGVRLWPKKSWGLVWRGVLSAVALVYAVLVATFPDEQMYLATNWLHRNLS